MSILVNEVVIRSCYFAVKIDRLSPGILKRIDKSKWLSMAGYELGNWNLLEHDLRYQILSLDAVQTDKNQYGQMYEIRGELTGSNGITIHVCAIWMKELETKQTKFITMRPDKRK